MDTGAVVRLKLTGEYAVVEWADESKAMVGWWMEGGYFRAEVPLRELMLVLGSKREEVTP